MRRVVTFAAALLLALGGVVGLIAGPAAATCYIGTSSDLEIFEAYRCETPLGWKIIETDYPGYAERCVNLNTIIDAAHPVPNGWANHVSSVNNNSVHGVGFFDNYNCIGTALFGMNAYTIREALPSALNNKANSVLIRPGAVW